MLCFFNIHTNFFTVFECAESCCASFSQRHQFASFQELPNRSPHALKMMPTVTDETEENNNTFVIFKIKSQHLFNFFFFLFATVHSDITLEFQAFLSHSVTTYTAEQGKRKNCDYDFKRKNNVCLSAYMSSSCSRFGKEFLSHPHSKRNEREFRRKRRREPEIQTHFSFFVCDFFLFICICTFVCAPFYQQKSCYYLLLILTTVGS